MDTGNVVCYVCMYIWSSLLCLDTGYMVWNELILDILSAIINGYYIYI